MLTGLHCKCVVTLWWHGHFRVQTLQTSFCPTQWVYYELKWIEDFTAQHKSTCGISTVYHKWGEEIVYISSDISLLYTLGSVAGRAKEVHKSLWIYNWNTQFLEVMWSDTECLYWESVGSSPIWECSYFIVSYSPQIPVVNIIGFNIPRQPSLSPR